MRSYEFTGKSVEKAIKEGLETLGKNQEDVDIEIVSEGGFLKKAKVIIKIEDEVKTVVKDKQDKGNFVEPETKVEETKIEEPEQAEVIEEVKEEIIEEKEPEVEQEEIVEVSEEISEEVVQQVEEVEKPKKQEPRKINGYVIPTEEELAEKRRKFAERHFENNQTSVEFIEGLLKVLKIDGKVSLEETKDASEILIETEDAGKIIGYRGDSIAAIQYIANIIEGNKNPHAKRVTVDSGDYKQKREQNLRSLAIRVAGKVSETGRPYKLDPMTAYERRIVHTELQNYPSVETHSEGVEPYRRIIVTKKK